VLTDLPIYTALHPARQNPIIEPLGESQILRLRLVLSEDSASLRTHTEGQTILGV